MNFNHFDIQKIHSLLSSKEISAMDLYEASKDKIERSDDVLKAFITTSYDEALMQAKEAQNKIDCGEHTLLTAIPYSLKDNISTRNIKTTCASKMLENYVPIFDATAVKRLASHSPLMMGKVNLDEFAMGASTENSAFFTSKNPFDLDRVPGGSSGGSATSVASGEVLFSLGSDTGGSVRQPAAFCGIVGLKPTYGRISRYGLVAFASSLDQIGILAKNVSDSAIVLETIAGKDEMDSTSSREDVASYLANLNGRIEGKKIGIIKELVEGPIDPAVKQAVLDSVKVLESLGCKCEFVELKHIVHAISTYYIIAPSEASSNLSRFDGIKYGYRTPDFKDLDELYIHTRSEGFGEEVKRRILLGTFALSAGYYDQFYHKALKVRTLIKQDFVKAFESYDLLLSPTAPSTAFKIGEKTSDPISLYLEDLCTVPVSLAGLPAISVPCGKEKGLPIGLQLIGNYFDEQTLLSVAKAFEDATDHNKYVAELEY